MFSYIPKSYWFPTSVDIKQAATIEELEKLCKAGEVERVVIPSTYYGYGASLIDDSNRRSIKKHYAANRFKDYGYSLTMSSYQFLKHFDFRELVEELQEQYPVFNEQDYSELETETKLEFIVDEISYALESEETIDYSTVGAHLSWTKDKVREILEDYEDPERVEYWESVIIDNDGATPYVEKTDLALLVEAVKEKAAKGKAN